MRNTVNIPIFENKVVLLIIGIIVGYLLFLFIKKNNPSLLNCETIEKFGKKNNDLYRINKHIIQPIVQPIVQPKAQPKAQPAVQPAVQPTAKSAAQKNGILSNISKILSNSYTKKIEKFSNDTLDIPKPNDLGENYAVVDNKSTIEDIHCKVPTMEKFTEDFDKPIKVYNFNTLWCGYSKSFQPEWDMFMNKIKSDPMMNSIVDVKDIKCDNDNNKQLCIDNEVYGYPTVIINVEGESSKYEGPRTSDGLMLAVNAIINPN